MLSKTDNDMRFLRGIWTAWDHNGNYFKTSLIYQILTSVKSVCMPNRNLIDHVTVKKQLHKKLIFLFTLLLSFLLFNWQSWQLIQESWVVDKTLSGSDYKSWFYYQRQQKHLASIPPGRGHVWSAEEPGDLIDLKKLRGPWYSFPPLEVPLWNMDRQNCINIIQHFMPSSSDIFGHQNPNFVFQQGNAPPHTARDTVAWDNQDFQQMLWPRNSPDVNIIEIIWGRIMDRWRNHPPLTIAELRKRVHQQWGGVKPQYLRSLYAGLSRWVAALRRVRGYLTNYWGNMCYDESYVTD